MISYVPIIALAILASVLLNALSNKAGVPTLFFFLLLGLLVGNIGIVPDISDLKLELCEFSEIALVIIIFFSGLSTRWASVRKMAVPSGLMASVGVIFTALATGLCTWLVLGWSWPESLLVAAVICSTDAASVFSALRSKGMGLKYDTAALLELESATNDPFAVLMTTFAIALFTRSHGVGFLIGSAAAQLLIGIVCGFGIAFLARFLFRKVSVFGSGQGPLLLIGVALLSWSVPMLLKGNGLISVYIAGLLLGNSDIVNKRQQVRFFESFTNLMQILLFFTLGMFARIAPLWENLDTALVISAVLIFVARPLATFLVLAPFGKFPVRQILMVSFSGLRGAPSIVCAMVAATSGIALENDLFSIVFLVVMFSTGANGMLLPKIAAWLKMHDDSVDVMENFNDFSDETDRQFSEIRIGADSPWAGKTIKEIGFPKDMLMVLLVHEDGSSVVPNGHTLISAGDSAVVCAKSFQNDNLLKITRYRLFRGDKNIGKTIRDCEFGKNRVMLVIRKDGSSVIAHSSTPLCEGDLLYVNQL